MILHQKRESLPNSATNVHCAVYDHELIFFCYLSKTTNLESNMLRLFCRSVKSKVTGYSGITSRGVVIPTFTMRNWVFQNDFLGKTEAASWKTSLIILHKFIAVHFAFEDDFQVPPKDSSFYNSVVCPPPSASVSKDTVLSLSYLIANGYIHYICRYWHFLVGPVSQANNDALIGFFF